jgi:hypothetical protein
MSQSANRRMVLLPLVALAFFGLRPVAAIENGDPDEKTLRDNKIALDGPGLLAFLRSRTLAPEESAKLKALVRQLGSDSFKDREKATAALLRYGRLALPALREGAGNADAEIASRSRRCIEEVNARPGPDLAIAALHRIAHHRPAGAAEVLLRYLPFADDGFVEEETLAALAALIQHDKEAGASLIKAIRDDLPLRRIAAARALGRAKDAKVRAPVRKLLTDPDARVRLEAAHSLLFAREKEALPVLIGLLEGDSSEVVYRAESLLLLAAGDSAPKPAPGEGVAARKAWRDAWASWWQTRGAGLDLSRIGEEEPKLGFVAVSMDSGAPQVWEYGRDRKERWRLTGLSLPMDVRVLPGETILVAGSDGVSEKDKSGKILWRKDTFGGALAAQRLPNRNLFIGTHTQLLEVDRAGKEVVAHTPKGGTLTDALRLPNGHVVFINRRGVLKEITWPTCKEVRTLRLSNAPVQATDWYRLEAAPGGRFLLASHSDGRVFEIDAGGKLVWEHKVPYAYSATRLANGHVLIATAESHRLIEVDRRGKIVHEEKAQSILRRVRAR